MSDTKFIYAQHKGGSRALRDAPHFSVDIILDVLFGCEFNCPGCFVDKKLPSVPNDLRIAREITEIRAAQGADMNELFLGPTDIFSAKNFDYIMDNADFQEAVKHYTLTCTATMLNDRDIINERLEKIKEVSQKHGRDLEIFVVLDIPKYLANDREYLDLYESNLELLELWNVSFDATDVFLMANVYSEDMFEEVSLAELSEKTKQDFNTKFLINPSFFRGTAKKHIERYTHSLKRLLEKEVTGNAIETVFLNMLDVYFGGFSFEHYAIMNHKLSVAPILYGAVPQPDDMFIVHPDSDNKYTTECLDRKQEELFFTQHAYASKTNECSRCEHLTSCVSRNVLAYMETRDITECFLPKTLFRDASKVIELENRKDGP